MSAREENNRRVLASANPFRDTAGRKSQGLRYSGLTQTCITGPDWKCLEAGTGIAPVSFCVMSAAFY